MKSKIVFIFLLSICIKTNAQNSLSGVYVNAPLIIGADTLYSFLQGKVIDSLSHKPIANVKVELYSSRGDALSAKTDSVGNFRINSLPSNNKIKIVCLPESSNKRKEWSFDTSGMTEPIQLILYFYLGK